ncbi:MAG: methionyl-tRNA formyltransferase, partial [Acidobacteria bacterium]
MASPRIAFFGSPRFAVPSLRRLLSEGYEVVAAVAQPDRPRGRGQKLPPGAVKAEAVSCGVRVLQPERLRDEAFLGELAALGPDLGVVAAYGKILPAAVLRTPRLGLLNVHASLLPRWRGASPIHRAVMAGDDETGISIMRVVAALDAGPVLETIHRPIGPDETSEEVERDLASMGADLLVVAIESLLRGDARETPQDESRATYAPLLRKEEGSIRWEQDAAAIHNQVRGLQPWPRAFPTLRGARVIVHRTTSDTRPAEPGGEGSAPRPG